MKEQIVTHQHTQLNQINIHPPNTNTQRDERANGREYLQHKPYKSDETQHSTNPKKIYNQSKTPQPMN